MAPSHRVRLDVRRLRDESVALEYEPELAEIIGEPNDSDDPEKLWTWADFKTKVLKVSESCLRDTSGTSKSFLTEETLIIIEDSRRPKLEGNGRLYRELKHEAVRALKRDKKGASPWSLRDSGEPLVVN